MNSSLLQRVKRFIFIAVCVLSFSVNAHQQKEAYTTLLFNERTNNLEIMHRFYLHDIEHAINSLEANNKNSDEKKIDNSNTPLKIFSAYIQDHFQLRSIDDNVIELDYVGVEIEGKYLWVYQELSLSNLDRNLKALKLNMTALQEVWPKQINHINIEKNGVVRSARLNKDQAWQTILFD